MGRGARSGRGFTMAMANDRRRHQSARLRPPRGLTLASGCCQNPGYLAEGRAMWAIAWPCLHEFLAIVTHPRIYQPPTPLDQALDQIDAWLESPSLSLIAEAEGYWEVLRSALKAGRVAGAQIHDARVAALCQHHGIEEL